MIYKLLKDLNINGRNNDYSWVFVNYSLNNSLDYIREKINKPYDYDDKDDYDKYKSCNDKLDGLYWIDISDGEVLRGKGTEKVYNDIIVVG